ncbi:MAG: DUF1467 family protein [Pseudomonadota bacterium]
MGIATAIAVYFLIWWTTLFISLPFRMRSQIDDGFVVEGSEPAAPANPQLLRRMLWNSVLSLGVFALYWLIFYYFGFSVDDLPPIVPEKGITY